MGNKTLMHTLEGVGSYWYNGWNIQIEYDSEVESPREWSNTGVMLCAHRRYKLGDDNAMETLRTQIRDSKAYRPGWERVYDFDNPGQLAYLAEHKCGFIVLPIYMYEHSGITIRTTPFDCPWDSGQVGIIFTSREAIYRDFGINRITKKWRERIEANLRAEVKVYDQFLRGETYYWYIVNEDNEREDGCGGYYDFKSVINDIAESIENLEAR